MIRPVLVWGTKGTCCSMLIWIIKKLTDPDYFVSNPVDESFAAHLQPMPFHWYGEQDLASFIAQSNTPPLEQIYHCEPNDQTWSQAEGYKNIVIYASTVVELRQIAIFQRYKNPVSDTYTVNDLFRNLAINTKHVKLEMPGALNLRLSEVNTANIAPTLDQLCDYLGIDHSGNYSDIINVHNHWYQGNKNLVDQHIHKLL